MHPAGLVLVTDVMTFRPCKLWLSASLSGACQQLGGLGVGIVDGHVQGHYEEGLLAVLTGGTATLAGTAVPLDARLQNPLASADCSLAEGVCPVTTPMARALPQRRACSSTPPPSPSSPRSTPHLR